MVFSPRDSLVVQARRPIQSVDITIYKEMAHFLQECISEGLYTELERAKFGRFIEALHLLGHQSLVYGFTF